MKATNDSLKIKELIKTLLKERGLIQKDLAEYLEVSLATVKRLLGKEDLSLQRVAQISSFFNMNTFELISLVDNKKLNFSKISSEQEKALTKDILTLKVFRALVFGLNIPELQKRYKRSEAEVFQQLLLLEKINLIEIWPKNRIRLLVSWPFQLNPKGQLKKTLIPKFAKAAFKLSSLKNFENLTAHEFAFSKQDIQDFQTDYSNLILKFQKIAAMNLKLYSPKDLTEYSVLMQTHNESIWDSIENGT